MTHTLSILLKNPADQPIVGATCTITADPANPSSSANAVVLSSVVATTDATGAASVDLIPSQVGQFYILRVDYDASADIISPFRFQMPAQDTSLDDLISGAIAASRPVPQGIIVRSSSRIETNYYPATDKTIVVSSTAAQFGDWVELYRFTHNMSQNAFTILIADLNFDPSWPHVEGDRGEIDLRMNLHRANNTIRQILVHHEYIYIRNRDEQTDQGSAEIVGIGDLTQGEYIRIDARGARQSNGGGHITLEGVSSGIQEAQIFI